MPARTTTSACSTSTRGCTRRRWPPSRRRSSSTRKHAGGPAQPRGRVLQHRATTTARSPSCASGCACAPTTATARWELGRAYALLGRHEDAIRTSSRALLRDDADDVDAIVQLGLAEGRRATRATRGAGSARARARRRTGSILHFYLGQTALQPAALTTRRCVTCSAPIQLNPGQSRRALTCSASSSATWGGTTRRAPRRSAPCSSTRRSRARRRTCRSTSSTPRTYERVLPGARGAWPLARRMAVAEGEPLAHYNLGLAFRQKGYVAEALREYRLALDRGEDRALVLQAMAELHLLRQGPGRGDRALRPPARRTQPALAQALERARRGAAPGGAARRGGGELRARARRRWTRTRWRSTTSAWRSSTPGAPDGAVDAFRRALRPDPGFVKARAQPRAPAHAQGGATSWRSRRTARCCESAPEQPVAWNGVGLVLADLRKFEEARNAFARAIQARPEFAEAHYNLSFTLSNLGDFDGALRETKRALELDPYYVAAEVRAGDRPRVRGPRPLGGARPRRRAADDGRGRRLHLRPARCSTRSSPSWRRAPRPRRRAATAASVSARARHFLCQGTVRPRDGGDAPRARARRRPRDGEHPARRRATSPAGRVRAMRSSGSEARAARGRPSRRAARPDAGPAACSAAAGGARRGRGARAQRAATTSTR